MITYRKKALKVAIFTAKKEYRYDSFAYSLADQIKKFIEAGEYSRIADIIIFGQSDYRTCIIIYEQAGEKKGG